MCQFDVTDDRAVAVFICGGEAYREGCTAAAGAAGKRGPCLCWSHVSVLHNLETAVISPSVFRVVFTCNLPCILVDFKQRWKKYSNVVLKQNYQRARILFTSTSPVFKMLKYKGIGI